MVEGDTPIAVTVTVPEPIKTAIKSLLDVVAKAVELLVVENVPSAGAA
jgi:hypothetical protein